MINFSRNFIPGGEGLLCVLRCDEESARTGKNSLCLSALRQTLSPILTVVSPKNYLRRDPPVRLRFLRGPKSVFYLYLSLVTEQSVLKF